MIPTAPPTKVYNVVVPVVANVAEYTPADAYRRLENALRAAGFEPMVETGLPDHDPQGIGPPFEAEAGTVADL